MTNVQDWDPDRYAKQAGFVAALGADAIALLDPQPGERILDLGCGDGVLTLRLIERGCKVTGVDASPEMVAAARARGVNARVMDGAQLDFAQMFDAVFSNAALHWMQQPERVAAAVWRALKPRGRFVGEFGAHGNVESIVAALDAALRRRGVSPDNPWYFPRPAEYRSLLETQGFIVEEIFSFPRQTPLPGDVGQWLGLFAQRQLSALPEAGRSEVVAEVVDALRPKLCVDGHTWIADYVRLRFKVRKPAA